MVNNCFQIYLNQTTSIKLSLIVKNLSKNPISIQFPVLFLYNWILKLELDYNMIVFIIKLFYTSSNCNECSYIKFII